MTTLVFHQHSSELLEYLHRLYQENQMCDTTVLANDGMEFKIHRVVLGSASVYLHQIFMDNVNDTIVCLDMTSAVLQILLQYCYTGQLHVSEEILPEVKQAATYLQMHKVVARLESDNKPDIGTLDWETLQANIGTLTADIKIEQNDFLQDGDANVDSFQDLKEDTDQNAQNKSKSSIDPTPKKKKTPRKTSKKRKSTAKGAKKQTISKKLTGDGKEVVQLKLSGRIKSKQAKEAKLTKIKACNAKNTKTKNLGTAQSVKSKKGLKTISKTNQKKTKITDKGKERETICSVSKSLEVNTNKSGISNKIYKPKKNPTKCEECNISFSSFYKLKRHNLILHTNDSIQHLHGQYILKRCLKGKQNLQGKRFCKKISTRLRMRDSMRNQRLRDSMRNQTKLSQRVTGNTLMQFIDVKLKQYKTLGSQLNKKDFIIVKTEPDIRDMSQTKRTRFGMSEGIFACTICNKQLTSQFSLHKHLQGVHQLPAEEARTLQIVPPEELVCEASKCDYTSMNLEEMGSHMEDQHPTIKHQCTQCQATFPITLSLDRHMVMVHKHDGDECQCNTCGKTFTKRDELTKHQFQKHNIQKPGLKVYECSHSGCHYKSLNLRELKIHKYKHIREKRFTCKTCGLKLKTEKSLKKHVEKKHQRTRPCLCQICGKEFWEDHELQAHCHCCHSGDRHYQCEYCPHSTLNTVSIYQKRKSRADIQREYRRRQKEKNKEEYLARERERRRRRYISHSCLTVEEREERNRRNRNYMRRYRQRKAGNTGFKIELE